MAAKKRRKRQVFDVTKAVKSNARDLLGTPPPTRVEPDPKRREKGEKHKPTMGELLGRGEPE